MINLHCRNVIWTFISVYIILTLGNILKLENLLSECLIFLSFWVLAAFRLFSKIRVIGIFNRMTRALFKGQGKDLLYRFIVVASEPL